MVGAAWGTEGWACVCQAAGPPRAEACRNAANEGQKGEARVRGSDCQMGPLEG